MVLTLKSEVITLIISVSEHLTKAPEGNDFNYEILISFF